MKNLKKVLSVLLVVAMLAATMVPAFAAETATISADAKICADIGMLIGEGSDGVTADYTKTAPTRIQAAIMLLRLKGLAADAAKFDSKDNFADVKGDEWFAPYTAYLKANASVGFVGVEDGKFAAEELITAQQYYKVVLTALGYVADKDYAYADTIKFAAEKGLKLVADVTDYTVNDLAIATVEALKTTVKDGTKTLATVLVEAKAIDEAKAIAAGIYNPVVAATMTATVVGAKKFNVAFNTAVDSAKATITVKKGSIAYNTAKFTWAEDKKSVVVEMATSLTKGDYEISVAGLSDTALTAKVTAEDEKVAKIEFTSDKAVLLDKVNLTDVNAFYKIYNQYNEDVTSSKYGEVTFSTSKGTFATIASKTLTINSASKFAKDEKIAISAVHASTSTFASAVLTVVDMAQVADVTIASLYNADDKTLSMTSDYGSFYLVVETKDQYGNSVPVANIANDVIVTTSDSTILDVKGGVSTPGFESKSINGSTKTVLALKAPSTTKAGTAVISIISKITGKLASYTVTVKETVKVDTLAISAPELAVAGEKVNLPFQAVDQFGAEMTKAGDLTAGMTTLTASVDSATIPLKFEQDYVTGKANLVLDASSLTAKKTVFITGQTKTNKFVTLSITVQAPVVPTTVAGLSSSYVTKMVKYAAPTLAYDKVVIKDQYSRDITSATMLEKYKLGAVTGGYRLVAESSDTAKVTLNAATAVSSSVYAIDWNPSLATPAMNAITLNGLAKGSSTVKISLQKWDATNAKWVATGDSYPATFTVVEKADISTYEVADVAKAFDVALKPTTSVAATKDYAKAITVNGVMADGSKVTVPYQYTVSGATYNNYYVNVVGNSAVQFGTPESGKLNVSGVDFGSGIDAVKEVTVPFVVTVVGNSGSVVITKNIVVSKEAPKLTTLSLVTNGVAKFEGGDVLSVKASDITATTLASVIADGVKTVDSYGIEHKSESAYLTATTPIISSIITNAKDASDTAITAPAITDVNLAAGTSFNVTLITVDGGSISFKVIVK